EIAFLLEWDDPTKSDNILRTEDFADGVAIQHPLSLENEQVWFAMGQPDAVMNIWHWNAEWEEESQEPRDMKAIYPATGWEYYPLSDDEIFYTGRVGGSFFSQPDRGTPVEDLNAAGLRTLTSQPAEQQNVKGKGVWEDGKWKVIFHRYFQTDYEYDVVFEPTKKIKKLRPIAFAIWDGGNSERDGQKAVSSFYFLEIASPQSLWGYAVGIGVAVSVLGVEVFLLRLFRRKKKR
ncbi:MAG: ethylbenzene dehydrogenase-related protein, partial [Candidatus Binatia bacterium]